MKKSIKKLSLNKKAISNLGETITGGTGSVSISITTINDPTAQTRCFICPVYPTTDPIDPFDPIDFPNDTFRAR